MADTEKLGSGLPELVINQLKAREELFAKGRKTTQDLLSINSNTGWIKLRSSVNTLRDEQAASIVSNPYGASTITGQPDTAREHILFGGTYSPDGMRQGVQRPDRNPNPAYTKKDSLGYRPMPGITDFTLKSKGSYGLVQEAVISFSVWSVEDLSKFEQLYFRPGFTALVEWGHSVYIDNEQNLKQPSIDASSISDTYFFDGFKADLEDKIKQKREATNGNYDGFFGFISNFSWSFRKDGGYDCTVKILSKGAALQALKGPKNSDSIPAATANEEKEESSGSGRKSVFHRIFNLLEKNLRDEPSYFNGKDYLSTNLGGKTSELQDFTVWTTDMDIKDEWDSIRLCYIPLRAVIDMLNVFGTLKNPSKPTQKPFPEFSIEYGEKFATFDDHFTCDPIVAVPPKVPSTQEYKTYSVTKSKLHTYIEQETSNTEGGLDDVLNIPVTTYFLRQQLNAILDGDQEQSTGILDFIKGVLSGLKGAFGEINDFDLHTIDDVYRVVDRNKFKNKKDKIPVINLTGLKSTISDLNVESKVSNDIASMVAIAAQGDSGNYHDNVATVLEWNYGVVDRHFPIKRVDDTTTQGEKEERRKKYKEVLAKAWKHFNDEDIWVDQEYNPELFNQVKQENITEIIRKYKEFRVSKKEQPQGVIPVELSLKMVGIGGLKVGTTFRINKGILPEKYNEYGFIITGISHNIGSDGKWVTDLQTQFFSLRTISNDEIAPVEDIPQETEQPEEEESNETPNADRLREVIQQNGYFEKGNELSNGGDITAATAELGIAVIKTTKQEHPGITLTFTGGNDNYHQSNSPNSRHAKGRGLDLVVSPSTSENVKAVKEILQGYAAGNNPNVRYLDEYNKPTARATGKHYHLSYGVGTEGSKNLSEASKLASQGKIKVYTV